MVTIDYAISASGAVLNPQIVFEGTSQRTLPNNAAEFISKGWQFIGQMLPWLQSIMM